MGRTIHITLQDKTVRLDLTSDFLTASTIKSQFLLSADAVVSLNFVDEGHQKGCECRNFPELSFVLPKNWPDLQFFVETDKIPSRPSTPNDISQSSAPVYVPIETDALVHHLEKYLFYEKGDSKACFTIISIHHAVSFAHGSHQTWNSNSAENRTSVTICSQGGQEFQTQLIAFNADMDFVLVHSEVPLVDAPPTISFPRKLERYILLGYPNVNSNYEALEGIFSSVQLDNKGRVRGSSGSQRGYSGGPIFNYRGELLGINVANESSMKFIGLSSQSTMEDLFNEVNAAFPSLSVIVPVYYLAMGVQENLNFQH